jgi:hypothetical protein
MFLLPIESKYFDPVTVWAAPKKERITGTPLV